MSLTKQEVLKEGFNELPHFTVASNLIYDLGRGRHLSFGSVGTPNEVLFICQKDHKNPNKINNLVCLHNFDFDGYMDIHRLRLLINGVVSNKKKYESS